MKKHAFRLFKCLGAYGLTLVFSAASTSADSAWAPCGGKTEHLWAWTWAGDSPNGSNLTFKSNNFGIEIVTAGDLSGLGNNYFNPDEFNENPPTGPAYWDGMDNVQGYSTNLGTMAGGQYSSGKDAFLQYMYQSNSMNATGEFYLAAALLDSRGAGNRVIWGTTREDWVRYDQEAERLALSIAGSGDTNVTNRGAWSSGDTPLLLEVWRDSSNVIHVLANNADVGTGVTMSGTFAMNGIGGGPDSGSSAFDDWAFEYIACNGLPTSAQRGEAREYLRAKWGLYGATSPPPLKPEPPSILTVE